MLHYTHVNVFLEGLKLNAKNSGDALYIKLASIQIKRGSYFVYKADFTSISFTVRNKVLYDTKVKKNTK